MPDKHLVLIDQSIKSPGGHHFEYAMRILKAARACGLRTTLLTHREFTKNLTDVRPIFSQTFWDSYRYYYAGEAKWQAPPQLVRMLRQLNTLQLNLRRRLLYSRLGLAYARGRHLFFQQIIVRAHLDEDFALVKSSRLALFAGRAHSVLLSYLDRTRRFPLFRIIRRTLMFVAAVLASVPAVALYGLLAIIARARDPAKTFAREFHRSVGNDFSDEAIIFVPNATPAELEALALLKRWRNSAARAQWAFLFRRPVFTGYPNSFAQENELTRRYRIQLARLKVRCPDLKVSFYTDTDELTAQYNFLGVYRFASLPVPVDDLARTEQKTTTAKNIVVGYLGDARDEKGFQHLPQLVDFFNDSQIDPDVRFLFQANFSSPQGDPGCRYARRILEGYRSDFVELVYGPFDSERYTALVQRMDAVLIPYASSSYIARSSGTLMEAVAAGLPAVVPSCTAMARLAEPARRRHLLSVLAGKHAALRRIGQLTGSYEQLHNNILQIDPRGNYFFLKLNHERDFAAFVRITLFVYDEFGLLRRGQTGAYSAIDGEIVAGFEIPGGSTSLLFQAEPIDKTVYQRPNKIELNLFEASQPLPLSAGIAIFDSPEQIPERTLEIVRFYQHHKQAAAVLQRELRSLYDPQLLVARLLGQEIIATAPAEQASGEKEKFVA